MSKKKNQNKISDEARTCFVFCAVCIVLGLAAIVFGNNFYKNVIDEEDVLTNLEAKIVSVDKVARNLSPSEKEVEEGKGYKGDELRYEYRVGYSVLVDDKEYTYTKRKRYYNNGSHKPRVGDTDRITGAVIDGEFIDHPETKGANQFNLSGYFLLALGFLAGIVGVFIRK